MRTGDWREIAVQQAKLSVARDGTATLTPAASRRAAGARGAHRRRRARRRARQAGHRQPGARRADRLLPAIAALIDPRQFELITRPTSGLIVVQGSAGSGKTTIGLHRIAYLAFAEPRRFRPERMLVVVYQRALADLRLARAALARRGRRAGDHLRRLGRAGAPARPSRCCRRR